MITGAHDTGVGERRGCFVKGVVAFVTCIMHRRILLPRLRRCSGRGSLLFFLIFGLYLTGVVSSLSSVSTTKTASSFAGAVVLAFRLTRWSSPASRTNFRPRGRSA